MMRINILCVSSHRRQWVVAAAMVLSASALQAADIAIAPGTYVLTHSTGCGTLTVESGMKYVWDAECDGGVDYRGRNVFLRGSTLFIDQATLGIDEQSETSFGGDWVRGENRFRATFVKQ